jgi:hypothetical protein
MSTTDCQVVSNHCKLSLHNNHTACILFRFINNVHATDYITLTAKLQLRKYWLMNMNAVGGLTNKE